MQPRSTYKAVAPRSEVISSFRRKRLILVYKKLYFWGDLAVQVYSGEMLLAYLAKSKIYWLYYPLMIFRPTIFRCASLQRWFRWSATRSSAIRQKTALTRTKLITGWKVVETFRTMYLLTHTKLQEIEFEERPPSWKFEVVAISSESIVWKDSFMS